MLVAGVQVADDLVVLRCRQHFDLVVEVDQSVVDVDPELVEQLPVLGKSVFVEHLHCVPEDDGMRDLHHRRLHVQREHHAGLVGVLHLLLVEVAQSVLAHEHAVDDVAFEQRHLRLEHKLLTAFGVQHHLHVACAIQRHRLLAVVEVAASHGRHMGARRHRPFTHAVRMPARVLLDRLRRAPVRVSLSQNGIDRAAEAFGVAVAEVFLLVGPGSLRKVRDLESLALQFLDGGHQLWH
jgi:hypothetical protein